MTELPEDREKSKDLGKLVSLLPFLRPYTKRILLAALALLVAATATLTLPLAFRTMIDLGFSGEHQGSINQTFLALMGVALVMALASAIRFYLVSWLGERVTADLRQRVYDNVLRLDAAFFETLRTGEVLSRLTTDTTLVQTVVGSSLSIALRSIITLIGALIMLVVTSPKLAGLALLGIPAVLVPIIVFGRKVRRLSRKSQDKIADMSANAGEVLGAMQIVQAFTNEHYEGKRFSSTVESAFTMAIRRATARALMSAAVVLIVMGAIIGVLWLGAYSVIDGSMSGGELAQFVFYAIFAAGATGAVSEVWGDLQRAAGALERLNELLQAKPAVNTRADAKTLGRDHAAGIVFDKVTFHYPSRPDLATLKDFSLELQAGETVALVGPSGAGKTTVFQLIMRFYDPQSGSVLVAGDDVRNLTTQSLRKAIGMVPQESTIFAADAWYNIGYGDPSAPQDDIRAAAKSAVADDFLIEQPEGYDSHLGERGIRLSGGQKQRIAIARAMLRNPPILLLDEATSALDAESEKLVQEALGRLMQGRTSLIIAHRLATVRKADRIIVMDRGRIVATGTHKELIKQGGLYARLAKLQFGTEDAA